MIKNFAKKIEYDIPQEIERDVLAVIHGYSKEPVKTTYPVYPIGFPLLIYVYADMPLLSVNGVKKDPEHRLNIAGQIYNADVQIIIDGMFGQIGFMLHPTSTYYLFHKPGNYFLNQWCTFREASPQDPKALIDAVQNSKTPLQAIDILISFFKNLSKNRLAAIEWLELSITKINERNGKVSLIELSESVGISTGYFRKKFKEVVGVSPKYYCKVIQLNSIFDAINAKKTERLLHIALDCGYYDQAHFINDFNRFIGNSPEKFLNGKLAYVKSYLGKIDG